jgi:S-adenosylmethionine:tRNA ribosyltransferase-isomerase
MDISAPTPDWRLDDFAFELPPKRIAYQPVQPRDSARLLHVRPNRFGDYHVYDLPDLLRPDDLLVLNDTKVIPARLYGLRGAIKVEVLLHKKEANGWLALARPGKRLHVGDEIIFAPDFSATVQEKRKDGEILLRFACDDAALFALLHRYGRVPLPPYIRRPQGDIVSDRVNYQTIYAAREGAVAAPTAGLHFTPELFARLEAKGIERVTVTLHVGAGTFLPVKTECVRDHHMHAEVGEISTAAAEKINAARRQSRRIVAVGTTSLRLLESVADEGGIVSPFAGETDIFIYPGYRFKCVDALMTNFHLPKSTLFMLVAAFAGLGRMRAVYAHAVAESYRFYSYGDATLLEKA